MSESVKNRLCKALENLSESSFRSFKNKLGDYEVNPGYEKIPRSHLEKAGVDEVVNLIIRYYTNEYGPRLTINVLHDINERQESADLQEAFSEDLDLHHEEKTPGKGLLKDSTFNEFTDFASASATHRRLKKGGQEKDKEQAAPKVIAMENEHLLCPEVSLDDDQFSTYHFANVSTCFLEPRQKSKQNSLSQYVLQETTQPYTLERETPVLSESVAGSPKDLSCHRTSALQAREENAVSSSIHIFIECSSTPKPRKSLPVTVSATPNITLSTPADNSVLRELYRNAGPLSDSTNKPATPRPPRGKPLRNIRLRALKKSDIELIEKNDCGKPRLFVRYLFQHFVPFETYQTWTKITNFDGYGGKKAIPKNLRKAIVEKVQARFPGRDKINQTIKNTINDLLNNPRKGGWPVLF